MSRRKKRAGRGGGETRREQSRPWGRRTRLWMAGAILAGLALVSGGLLVWRSDALQDGERAGALSGSAGTAAIVDQLSLTAPNPNFVKSAKDTLRRAGYDLAYYRGEKVTVDFYRYLPTHDYDLIILRAHSARMVAPDLFTVTDDVSLFTSEPFSWTKHVEDRALGRLRSVAYDVGEPEFFGIAPGFIEPSMKGGFEDTTIIMMGCDGLRSAQLGEALLQKGARSFISWDQPVSASHADRATERLLEHLLLQGIGPADAVRLTAAEVGPDPYTGAELRVLTSGG